MSDDTGIPETLSPQTRALLKSLSMAFMKMHKCLLDDAKIDYEAQHGQIRNLGLYFQLVIDHPHFGWLRKISALIALIDEATSLRRPATEAEARGLVSEAEKLLGFGDAEQAFNESFKAGLARSAEASTHHAAAVVIASNR